MKKLVIGLMLFAVLFSMAGCAARGAEPGLTVATGEPYDLAAGKFPAPPKGYVVTKDGNIPLQLGGYTWSQKTGNGTGKTFHADQSIRPLPVENMEMVRIIPENLWDGATYYSGDPPFMIKYGDKVTLDWQVMPDSVECVFWPVNHQTTGVEISCEKDSFMAHMGCHIYEITAGWLDHGNGYSGKASFYIYVIVEMEGEV